MNVNKTLSAALMIGLIATTAAFAKPKYISPNSDGTQDELTIPLNISDKRYIKTWNLIILDENGNEIRRIGNKEALPEKVGFKSFFKQLVTPKKGVEIPDSVTWNGAMNNGETAPDGKYFYYISATDDNDNVGETKRYEVIIDTVAPEIDLTQPADRIFGEGAKSFLKIVQAGSVEDEWTGTFKAADGTVVRTYKWTNSEPLEFKWYGTKDDDSQVMDGVYSYEITATDRAGNIAQQSVINNIIYSAEKPATNIYVDGSRYFSPETQSKNSTIAFNLSIPVPEAKTGNKLTEWDVVISDKAGNPVRTYNRAKDGDIPPESIIFDGKDDNDKKLADGEYQACVSAKYLNGYEPNKIYSPVIILDTEKPEAQIKPSETIFGAGQKSTVTFAIMITPADGAPVPEWNAHIENEAGDIVKTFQLGEYPPESITWNGLTDKGQLAEKGDYYFVIESNDLAGNIGGGKSANKVTFDTTEAQLLLTLEDSAFSPNGDKSKDTLTITPITQTPDVADYLFEIKNAAGKTVYSVSESKKLPKNFVWDGKDSGKIICEDGTYMAQLSVTTSNGSKTSASTPAFVLDTVAPSIVTEIPWTTFSADGDGNQDTIPVAIKECTNEKLWTMEIRGQNGKSIKKISWNGSKSELEWDGTDESGNIAADGIYSINFYSTDDAGNSFKATLKDIVLDNRETKTYITAENEGISPNGDGFLDTQEFAISVTVPDSIASWNFDIRKEDGSSVYGWSNEDSAYLPEKITWNGADRNGNACEGTYTGTLNITYTKGNRISAVSTPFVCTATPPQLKVKKVPEEYFSPDNDGVADDQYIQLEYSTKTKIKNWSFIIRDPKGKDFWKTSGKSQITKNIAWDGLSNTQKDANGNAERVQSAMDYPYEFTVTDNLGMTSVEKGMISVDVLVIREGNILKMAVPSIIFESDAANFQDISGKLTQEQIDKNLRTLNRIADILKKFKDYKVTIVGHANRLTNNPEEETVDNPRNWGRASTPLSKERADAIKTYLISRGVSANNLATDGRGGTQPVVNPTDKDNNWKNRRVEFLLEK